MDTPFFHVGTTKLSATSTATRGTLSGNARGVGNQILVYNAGPDTVYIDIGESDVTATVPTSSGDGGLPIPADVYIPVFSRSVPNDTHVSAICESGETATVFISVGNGV